MALIKCPECGKEISDKATNCPNCGYPTSISQGKESTAPKTKELFTVRMVFAAILIVVGIFAMYQSQLCLLVEENAALAGMSLSLIMIISGIVSLLLRNSRKSLLFKIMGVILVIYGLTPFAIHPETFTALYEHGIVCIVSGIIFCITGSMIKMNNSISK